MNDNGILKRLSKTKIFPYLLLSLAAGIALLLIPHGSSDEVRSDTVDAYQYAFELEGELESLINKMDGVGGCKVMVYLDSSFSYLYATDQKLEYDGERRHVSKQLVFSKLDGDELPIVIEEYLPSISGVAVVLGDGGSHAEKIKNMLSVLLDLDESRIFVTS